jgi:hypothetical protein
VSAIIHGKAQDPRNAGATATTEMHSSICSERSPLEQLLHGLNQPLTGLQCSMEVALASPRTPEQYAQGLREGLELMERMRALVEALREVVDGEKEKHEERDMNTIDLKTLLCEVVDDLEPVADAKGVRIEFDWTAAFSFSLNAGRRNLGTVVFRFVESALGLADAGGALRIEAGGVMNGDHTNEDEAWIRLRWRAASSRPACSRPELGLIVAQAGWERVGAQWERERIEDLETVTVRWPLVSGSNAMANSGSAQQQTFAGPGDPK